MRTKCALTVAGLVILDYAGAGALRPETGVKAFVHLSIFPSATSRQYRYHEAPTPPSRFILDAPGAMALNPTPRGKLLWRDSIGALPALGPSMTTGTMAVAAAAVIVAAAAAAAATATAARAPRKGAQITVRRAREADFEGVAGIRGVIVPVGMSGVTGFLGSKVVIDDPQEAKRRMLMAKVADLVSREAVALIALERGLIVGTVDCIIQPSEQRTGMDRLRERAEKESGKTPRPRVFLKNLFVLPEHRRRGVAVRLVEEAEAFARREGAETLCLQVARKNAPAKKLYVACGFEEVESPGQEENGLGGLLLRSLGMGKIYMAKRV